MTEAFPLAWPDGWPRTPMPQQVDGRYQFKKVGSDGWRKPYTFAQARDALNHAAAAEVNAARDAMLRALNGPKP